LIACILSVPAVALFLPWLFFRVFKGDRVFGFGLLLADSLFPVVYGTVVVVTVAAAVWRFHVVGTRVWRFLGGATILFVLFWAICAAVIL
jgi:hypothetical protein